MTDRDTDLSRDHDLVGSGTGGTPTAPGAPTEAERRDAAADPDVAAMVRNLETDEGPEPVDIGEASEQAGSGTDA